jgi:phage-related protein
METFAWLPTQATLKRKPRTLNARFGDGYEQRAQDGLNADLQVWEVKFENCHGPIALAIDDFLAARGASEAFLFTTKRGETLTVLCRSWEVADADKRTAMVSATFEQVVV